MSKSALQALPGRTSHLKAVTPFVRGRGSGLICNERLVEWQVSRAGPTKSCSCHFRRVAGISGRKRLARPPKAGRHLHVENRELLTGDCLLLVAFCLYKQITAIILNPAFPGWLEPLHFNPGRFGELASFSTTLTVSWVLSSLLVGGYRSTASADVRSALRKASEVWLISMPVAACQLVLLTAAEGQALVGSDLFASSLPLAASGPGEPVATAAGVLGIMAIWRCFYAAFLDYFNFLQWTGGRANLNRLQDMNFFVESLKAVFLLAIACTIVIQYLSQHVGEEHIRTFLTSANQMLSS